ncbi:hypothetical protein JRG66_10740 [Salinimicrobium tongyeongense]|uniref:Uncharacterized protein n=1 Tax=Salinimicrobium tongyeongense TaxID=2809707 RepID=A0ABY6NNJ0_9FLAO|nr:hypothetical protein [Salinimicrobium tongyeongense]UZH54456.1 hypothetical protein JRG66_10740 [Salinimicrobium tongyeongense]
MEKYIFKDSAQEIDLASDSLENYREKRASGILEFQADGRSKGYFSG